MDVDPSSDFRTLCHPPSIIYACIVESHIQVIEHVIDGAVLDIQMEQRLQGIKRGDAVWGIVTHQFPRIGNSKGIFALACWGRAPREPSAPPGAHQHKGWSDAARLPLGLDTRRRTGLSRQQAHELPIIAHFTPTAVRIASHILRR